MSKNICKHQNLDECIMDVLVEPEENGQYRLKLIAVIGGTGPEMSLPKSILEMIRDRINTALGNTLPATTDDQEKLANIYRKGLEDAQACILKQWEKGPAVPDGTRSDPMRIIERALNEGKGPVDNNIPLVNLPLALG